MQIFGVGEIAPNALRLQLFDDLRQLLLQGVIDCAFLENGAWHVLDYKTDRVTDEDAFVARHRMQLAWYARALREISGVPVKPM